MDNNFYNSKRIAIAFIVLLVLSALKNSSVFISNYKEFTDTNNTYIDLTNTGELDSYIKTNGYNEVSYYYKGNEYFDKEKYEEAINQYKQGLAINPKFERTYGKLGYAYDMLNNDTGAIDTYTEGLKICKERCDIINHNFGIFYENKEEYEDALTFYKKSSEINPEDTEVQLNIASTLMSLNREIEVIDYLEKFHSEDEEEMEDAYFMIGTAYYYIRDYNNAINYYKKAQVINPNDEDTNTMIAKSNDLLKCKTSGICNTGSLANNSGSINISSGTIVEQSKNKEYSEIIKQGETLFGQNKYQETIDYLRDLELGEGTHFEYLRNYYLGKAWYAKGNYEKAYMYFREAQVIENNKELEKLLDKTDYVGHAQLAPKINEEFLKLSQNVIKIDYVKDKPESIRAKYIEFKNKVEQINIKYGEDVFISNQLRDLLIWAYGINEIELKKLNIIK